MNMYTQCSIQYQDGSHEIAWIPSCFADIGKAIIIKNKNAKVDQIYAMATESDLRFLQDRSKQELDLEYKGNRKKKPTLAIYWDFEFDPEIVLPNM